MHSRRRASRRRAFRPRTRAALSSANGHRAGASRNMWFRPISRRSSHLFSSKEKHMMQIKVLGTGCAKCRDTVKLIEATAKEKGAEINLEKVENLAEILA